MATWASAIGVGQAPGPPLGGLVADVTGWRSIFVVHAVFTATLALVLAKVVPHMRPRRPPMHVAGMVALIGGVGSLVVAFTWAGQGGPLVLEITLVLFGLALAAAMALFAPISSRIAERLTPRRVLHIGLVTLVVGPLLLASASTDNGMGGPVWILAILMLIGCGIGAVQSSAAFGVMRSPAAARGSALGIHNMMRFAGLALGYAWVAATYPLGNLFLVYSGPAMLAAAALLLTFIGPPAPPVQDPSSGNATVS
jgi:predicted MFS family arabinose efflux permease